MQFTGFHLSVGKTFAGLASSVLKESVAQKIYQENFRISLKLQKPQNFSLTQLCCLWYYKTVKMYTYSLLYLLIFPQSKFHTLQHLHHTCPLELAIFVAWIIMHKQNYDYGSAKTLHVCIQILTYLFFLEHNLVSHCKSFSIYQYNNYLVLF